MKKWTYRKYEKEDSFADFLIGIGGLCLLYFGFLYYFNRELFWRQFIYGIAVVALGATAVVWWSHFRAEQRQKEARAITGANPRERAGVVYQELHRYVRSASAPVIASRLVIPQSTI